jgi:hypothetical protein
MSCGGNFLNSQVLKATGRTGLQGNDVKLTLQEIYPVWPRNDAFPQLLISKYCIHLHKYAVSDSSDIKESIQLHFQMNTMSF